MEKSFHASNGSGRGIKELMTSPNRKARAAIAAGLIMIKSAHPEIKAKKLPKDKRKYSYKPPDSSVSEAKALTVKAANKLIRPASTQAIRIAVSPSPVWAMGTIFLNTPLPITIPTTIKVLAKSPNVLFSDASVFTFSFMELPGFFSICSCTPAAVFTSRYDFLFLCFQQQDTQ